MVPHNFSFVIVLNKLFISFKNILKKQFIRYAMNGKTSEDQMSLIIYSTNLAHLINKTHNRPCTSI